MHTLAMSAAALPFMHHSGSHAPPQMMCALAAAATKWCCRVFPEAICACERHSKPTGAQRALWQEGPHGYWHKFREKKSQEVLPALLYERRHARLLCVPAADVQHGYHMLHPAAR